MPYYCFILSIGIQCSQRVYWMNSFLFISLFLPLLLIIFLFILFSFCEALRFTWPSPFERIHDSQNTYPIKFQLSAATVVILSIVVWKCWSPSLGKPDHICRSFYCNEPPREIETISTIDQQSNTVFSWFLFSLVLFTFETYTKI